jgi:SAM-dependent methyltransferase
LISNVEDRYYDGTYLTENPDWDRKDAPWKAVQVASILSDNKIEPYTVCEVGCGSGDVLVQLQKALPSVKMTGYDISPQAAQFWEQHNEAGEGVEFQLGDFLEINQIKYDVLPMLDVFEHIRDPFSFLENSRRHATHFVFHVPLDLSASAIFRGYPLIKVRKKAGHLHYYTKDLALSTLLDTGYEILDWRYTGASLNSPNRSLKTRLAALPRRIAYAVNKDFGVRLLGGETLLVLAKPLS